MNRKFAIPSSSDEVDLGDEPVDSDSSTEDFNENLSHEVFETLFCIYLFREI